MKYTVILEYDEDGIYVVSIPALPGCISDGKTVEEALANIREAIQCFIDDMKSDGDPIPEDAEIIGTVEVDV
ncbi:MAG: type II toxin-antitoxin system HicB family antitoxin [Thermoplasmataceae archaeon]|jgi:predicted RNase H-like HicB family nuclease